MMWTDLPDSARADLLCRLDADAKAADEVAAMVAKHGGNAASHKLRAATFRAAGDVLKAVLKPATKPSK